MASPVDTSVRFMHSGMPGAMTYPTNTGGTTLALLDAFLVTGWGAKVVDSATITSGVCRLNFSTGISAAEPQSVIEVSGATPAGLNGPQKVTAVTATYVEFLTALPDGPVTGSLSFKMASLGWEKVFSKTNVTVYRPTDPTSPKFFFRVDDSNNNNMRVHIYEDMSDVDTGTGMAPLSSTVSGGYFWAKSSATSAASKPYLFIGNSKSFYWCNAYHATSTPSVYEVTHPYQPMFVGAINSLLPNDRYAVALIGSVNAIGSGAVHHNIFFTGAGEVNTSILRKSSGIGNAVTAVRIAGNAYVSGGGSNAAGNMGGPLPNQLTQGFAVSPIYMSDGGTFGSSGVRGTFPGVIFCLNTNLFNYLGYGPQIISTNINGVAKNILYLQTTQELSTNTSTYAGGFFDLTGPWG